ncbi:MAG TPA: carbon-nitrogen hydrolase family protein [Terriglobia bacterium]|nr:carbon-nitrogen hydrolase family protein [Terriglobia bacterium]
MKVAAVQMDVRIFDKGHNLRVVLEKLVQARRAGAELMIFPECALTGYCFTSREEAWPLAETVPGPSTEKVALAARQLGCTVVLGMLEREGEELYNAAAVIAPGGILGSYRKIHLLCLGLDRYDAPGNKPFRVFETPAGKVGVNICFDCSFPESGRVLKLQGAQILAIPTNWPVASDTWAHTPIVRATENHIIVVAADRVGEERGFRFAGHSQIVHPEGRVLASANDREETVLVAEVDPAGSDRNRVVRVPGEYEFDRIAGRRPEMYGSLSEGGGS